MTTYVLQALQEELRNQTNIPDLLIGEAFDVVAGTSTGSILATYLTAYCGLAEPQTVTTLSGKESVVLDGTAENAILMYKLFAEEIFSKGTAGRWKLTWKGLGWNKPVHDDKGLERVLDLAFGHLTLEWLANRTNNKLLKFDGKEVRDAHVASLFVAAYDLTYRRPVAFMADRHFQTARFFGVDPFSRPFKGGGFQVLRASEKALEWYNELENAHREYKKEFKRREGRTLPYTANNLGDAQLPLQTSLTEDFNRYQRSLDGHLDERLSKICRCSTAAPAYLAPGRIENFFDDGLDLVCCDGGVVANAPAQTAFNALYFQACAEYGDDILRDQPSMSELDKFDIANFTNHMVLSIGCGQTAVEVDPRKAPSGGLRSYLLGSGNLIDVLMSSSSQLSHVNMDALFASRDAWQNYLRIQLSVNQHGSPGFIKNTTIVEALTALDNASPDALAVYKEVGEYLAAVYRPLIKKFVTRMLE